MIPAIPHTGLPHAAMQTLWNAYIMIIHIISNQTILVILILHSWTSEVLRIFKYPSPTVQEMPDLYHDVSYTYNTETKGHDRTSKYMTQLFF